MGRLRRLLMGRLMPPFVNYLNPDAPPNPPNLGGTGLRAPQSLGETHYWLKG